MSDDFGNWNMNGNMNMMMNQNVNRNDTSKNAYILVYEKIAKKPLKLIE